MVSKGNHDIVITDAFPWHHCAGFVCWRQLPVCKWLGVRTSRNAKYWRLGDALVSDLDATGFGEQSWLLSCWGNGRCFEGETLGLRAGVAHYIGSSRRISVSSAWWKSALEAEWQGYDATPRRTEGYRTSCDFIRVFNMRLAPPSQRRHRGIRQGNRGSARWTEKEETE